jgi:NAD+-dependent secondary alcohol dehydrogenase Adh1
VKAAVLHAYDQPLSVEDIAEPDLRGPHDVIVRVGGAGLCRTDLHLIDGWFKDIFPFERPFTLGHENAGWVETVGDAVTSVRPGDAVIVHPLMTCGVCSACRDGNDMYCTTSEFPGLNTDGGFAEYLRTSERALVRLPEELEPHAIAPYADAGLAAYHAARKLAATTNPSQTIVVIGIGGLGHIGLQVLRALTSSRIIAVDPSPTAQALGIELGADAVIGKSPTEEVMQLTEGLGADAVVDFVGEGSTPRDAVSMLRQGGTYLLVGYGADLNLPTLELILKEITLIGNLVGSYRDLRELIDLARRGKVSLRATTYPLSGIGDAVTTLRNGELTGRAVIVPTATRRP